MEYDNYNADNHQNEGTAAAANKESVYQEQSRPEQQAGYQAEQPVNDSQSYKQSIKI